MLKLLKNVAAFIFIAGVSSAIGQQISGGGGGGGGGGGTPGGSNTQVQFNNAGAFGGDSGLTYSSGSGTLAATTSVLSARFSGNAALTVVGTAANDGIQLVGGAYTSTGSTKGIGLGWQAVGSLGIIAGGKLGFVASGTDATGGLDTMFSRGAPATMQLGDVDAAAPVAQTFQTQSVVAGTTNTAGADWTINGSVGTGTGVGGNIILRTAPAGTTGTAQNALSQVAIVDSKSHIRVGNTAAPALTSCGTSPTIIGTDVAGTVTMGTTATGCVITFKTAYANAPICNVTWRATPLASQSYALSTTAITITQTSTSNDIIDYHCFAQNAG